MLQSYRKTSYHGLPAIPRCWRVGGGGGRGPNRMHVHRNSVVGMHIHRYSFIVMRGGGGAHINARQFSNKSNVVSRGLSRSCNSGR